MESNLCLTVNKKKCIEKVFYLHTSQNYCFVTIFQHSHNLNSSISNNVSLIYKFFLHKIQSPGHIANLLWQGVLLVEFMEHGTMFLSHVYCKTVEKLKQAIQNKHCRKLTFNVVFCMTMLVVTVLKNSTVFEAIQMGLLIIPLTASTWHQGIFISSLIRKRGLHHSTSMMMDFKMPQKISYKSRRLNFMKKKYVIYWNAVTNADYVEK